MDLDIVVAPENSKAVKGFLKERGFEKANNHARDCVYDTKVVEYEKRLAPREPIGFDLLVNGLRCRQTEAQWSFDYLYNHSTERNTSSGISATTARVVDGAVLIAAKLHSGREGNFRDVLAVAEEVELDTVTPHFRRGDVDALRIQLEQGLDILEGEELKHGFRSDFGSSVVSKETIASLRAYLFDQIDQLS